MGKVGKRVMVSKHETGGAELWNHFRPRQPTHRLPPISGAPSCSPACHLIRAGDLDEHSSTVSMEMLGEKFVGSTPVEGVGR